MFDEVKKLTRLTGGRMPSFGSAPLELQDALSSFSSRMLRAPFVFCCRKVWKLNVSLFHIFVDISTCVKLRSFFYI